MICFQFSLHLPCSSLLPVPLPGGSYSKLSLDTIFTVFSHTFSSQWQWLWESKVSIKFLYALLVYLCLSSRDLFIFIPIFIIYTLNASYALRNVHINFHFLVRPQLELLNSSSKKFNQLFFVFFSVLFPLWRPIHCVLR